MNNQQDASVIKNEVVPSSEIQSSSGSASFSGSTPQDPTIKGVTGVSNVNDTTVFVDDNDVAMQDESTVAHVSNSIVTLNDTQAVPQDILSFLMKPIVLSSGTFSTSDTYTLFNSIAMPSGAFTSAQGTLWTRKLQGYFGIRMDMRFRLVINANRFQQGRYCVGWTPLAGMKHTTSNLKALRVVQSHNATLVQRTTVPHVEIDLCTGTSAELLVPFVSTQAFFPLNTILSGVDQSLLGYVNLYPYSPLAAPTGNTTAGYTLYVSFENIHLFGAASPQGGGTQRKEVTNKNNGPVSGVAKAFSRGFKEFSTIPLLGSYAKDISWIADRVANVAGIFGFVKPTQGDSSTKMMNINATNHSTIDGDADSRSLALINCPSVAVLDGLSGTTFDEMDISYLARRYSWFQTTTWVPGDNVGTLNLFSVDPFGVFYAAGSTYNFPPVAFVTRFFRMWRGSVKYRMKLVKTEFHSGRLAISFHPSDESTYTGLSVYVNRIIVDIREKNTIEFVVPYISRHPWTPISFTPGRILVEVVDPLVAPDTVTQSITVLWEIAGGDDYEVAIPGDFDLAPTSIVPQAGDDTAIFSSTLGTMEVRADPLVATSFCIGEKITSIRALLKRYHPITMVNSESTMFDDRTIRMTPDVIIAWGTTTDDLSSVTSDPYSLFASCYAMVRGGFRIRDAIAMGYFSSTTSTDYALAQSQIMASLSTATPGSQSAVFSSASFNDRAGILQPMVFQTLGNNPVMSVEVPQYTSGYARAKADIILYQQATGNASSFYTGGDYSSGTKASLSFTLPKKLFSLYTGRDSVQPLHNIFRAGADDLDLCTFISIPPLLVKQPSSRLGFN